jgi:hypothetical protein
MGAGRQTCLQVLVLRLELLVRSKPDRHFFKKNIFILLLQAVHPNPVLRKIAS